MKLLSAASDNTKTRHSQEDRPQFRIVGLALSPADAAPDLPTNCPSSSTGCRAACVGGSGVGLASVWPMIMAGRIAKTQYLRRDRAAFIRQLLGELQIQQNAADQEGTTLAVRLNTFSDIPWEVGAYGAIPQQFPNAMFYDYTKIRHRATDTDQPPNYTLCFSRSENNEPDCRMALSEGVNVAVVFANIGSFTGPRAMMQRLPRTWQGFRVYDGDSTDLRFLDPTATAAGRGRVCGLRLKAATNEGREAAIKSGFAVIVD